MFWTPGLSTETIYDRQIVVPKTSEGRTKIADDVMIFVSDIKRTGRITGSDFFETLNQTAKKTLKIQN